MKSIPVLIMTRPLRCSLISAVLILESLSISSAATLNWDITPGTVGAGNNTLEDGPGAWDTTVTNGVWTSDAGTNNVAWVNNVGTPDSAIFGGGTGAAGTVTVGSINVEDITFGTPGSGNYTLSGGTLTLGGASPTLTANINAAITSTLAGTGPVNKAGTGNLTLTSGTGGNTFTGGMTVQAGTLTLNGANFGGSTVGPGTLTIESNGIVVAGSHNVFGQGTGTHLSPIVINGGQLTPAQYNHLNSIAMTAGTINAGTSTGGDGLDMRTRSAVLPTVTTNASATTATINAKMTLSNNTTFSVADGGAATDLQLGGQIVGAGTFTKAGSGQLNLTGNMQSYAAALAVNGGTFNVGGTNLFTAGHSTAKQSTFSITVDNATLSNTSGVVNRIGNVNLNNGAIWTLTGASTDWGTYYLGPLSNAAEATVAVGGSSASTINGNGNLKLGNNTAFNVADVTGNANADLTVSVVLENQTNAQSFAAAGLTKSGAGTMVLSNFNTYTGGTTVSNGTLVLNTGNTGTGVIRGALTVNSGATVRIDTHDAFGYTSAAVALTTININGGTVNNATNTNETATGATFAFGVNGGTLQATGGANSWFDFFNNGFGNTTVTTNGAATATATISSRVNLRQSNTIFTVNNGTQAIDLEMSGPITSASGNGVVIKEGAGLMRLNAANTFAGGLTVNAGTVSVIGTQLGNRLPNGSSVTINNAGTFSVDDVNPIPTAGNSINVTANAGGTLNFGSAATHAHLNNLTLNGGAVTSQGSGKYDSEDFQLNGTVTVGGSAASTITLANGIGLIGNRTFNVADATGDSNADLILGGVAAGGILQNRDSGANGMIKSGLGTMAVNAASTYTGTTSITAGTLLVNGTHTGGGLYTVGDGSGTDTLGGSGTINANVNILTGGGVLAPGTSPGILTINGNVSIAGTLESELAGITVGTNYDQLQLGTSGGPYSVTLSGTLTPLFSGTGWANPGDKLWIVNNVSGGGLTGVFSNYPSNGQLVTNYDGKSWLIYYGADFASQSLSGGNDVVLTAVPEPHALLLLALSATGFCVAIRDQRQRRQSFQGRVVCPHQP